MPKKRRSTNEESELPEKMPLTQARRYLNVSFTKMTALVRSGLISYETNPLDYREKLVKRSDLEALKRGIAKG
jgi:hypothetical protein